MAYRGSLRQCIQMLGYQLSAANYYRLTIVCNERAKYYTLHTEEELDQVMIGPLVNRPRIVCSLTIGELRQFANNSQIALDLETPPDD